MDDTSHDESPTAATDPFDADLCADDAIALDTDDELLVEEVSIDGMCGVY